VHFSAVGFRLVKPRKGSHALIGRRFSSYRISGMTTPPPFTHGLPAGYQLHITFDPFTGDIAIGGSACRDDRATLKMMHPSVEALLGLDKRALEDLTLPRTKFTDYAPKTISSGSWAVRIYVNLHITKAQCLQSLSPLGAHNCEVHITTLASMS